MANLKKPFYFCNECKKIIGNLDDLLFIDEFSSKGFCSEVCIEDFYIPLIRYYEVIEKSLRAKHGVVSELHELDERDVEETLKHPSEVYRQSNELRENYYHFIKHYSTYSVIVVSSVYQNEASFVFMSTQTSSLQLIDEFRSGHTIHDWGVKEDILADDSPAHTDLDFVENMPDGPTDDDMVFMQLLESKKSKILADILIKRSDNDIPFEDYTQYDYCFQDTLDFPDEVFERKDQEGDVLFSYIRTFSQGFNLEDSFFYIIICLKQKLPSASGTNVYPLLAIPTKDMELCQEFRQGQCLTGPLKN